MKYMKNGLRITIEHDDLAGNENPLKEDGHNMGGFIFGGRGHLETFGDLNTPTITREMIKRKSAEILALFNYHSLYQLIRENNFVGYKVDIEEIMDTLVHDLIENSSDSEKLTNMAALFDIADFPYLRTTGQGYAQGDWHMIFIAHDPGLPMEYTDVAGSLKAKAEEYRDWRYGDVYYYLVERPITCECCDNTTYETVESCGSFIGTQGSDTYKYMVEQAESHTTGE